MVKGTRVRKILTYTGVAALVAVAVNLVLSVINSQKQKEKKRDLLGLRVFVNLSASEIHRLADQIIAKSNETHDLVSSVPLENVTYKNVICPLMDLEEQQYPLVQSCLFPKMVATSEDVRKASADAEKKLDSHFLKCRKREDVYRVIKAFVKKGEWLDLEARRYVQCLVKEFERSGMNLTSNKLEEMESLRSEMEKLSFKYIHNLNNDASFLLLSEGELDGMPPQFMKSLDKTDGGKMKVLLKTYHVSPILEYCKLGATRKSVAAAYWQRCGRENLHILENLVQLRHKFARLLGYSSYADFVTETRMAKTSIKVLEFLEEVSNRLSGLATRELNFLKNLKVNEEGDTYFGMEDLLYYMRRAEELLISLDPAEVRQYFPVNLVLSGIFKIFQDLFGLKFEEVDGTEVWHETVHLYSVLDLSSSELLGFIYLDLFSREGKFTHTCVMSLQHGCMSSKGTRQIPVSLLISQCSKPVDESPVLIRFSDVISLFHEFTHLVWCSQLLWRLSSCSIIHTIIFHYLVSILLNETLKIR